VVTAETRESVRLSYASCNIWRRTDSDSSDADVEVLADYVVALVTANETEGSLKENCLESLADFLQDSGLLHAARA
jgi:hypothetical protein